MSNLQNDIQSFIGRGSWSKIEIPSFIISSLNPDKELRPYQIDCFKYLISYFEEYDNKSYSPNLLFHMATGSGKTLIMAGAIIYLFSKGYRNFLFFVHLDSILTKTKENFLNKCSKKYLFSQSIFVDGREIEINQVNSFDESREDCINICFTSIHKLHSDFTTPKENSLTFESFSDRGVVLISDEAHHLNADTKKGKLTEEQQLNKFTWEEIVSRIHMADNNRKEENILLEFTATEDLKNPNIANKYENKIIFDYPLKVFRKDGYSKEISSIGSDTKQINRFIQAIVLSQYKKHLFASVGVQVKPVVLFKSKTKNENKKFYKEAIAFIDNLSYNNLKVVFENSKEDVFDAFQYFFNQDKTFESLISEIKQDFDISHSVIIDTDHKVTDATMIKLNSLEDDDNSIRAIYAVDMLNEGWDVLNLFDIVRLYNTRDGKYIRGEYVPGTTTNAEAQLIGRGARYFPFDSPESNRPRNKRKFDTEINNPLRVIETLHYHCSRDPEYIRELRNALVKTGAIDSRDIFVEEKIKDEFKKTELYKKGYVFANKLVKRPSFSDVSSISQFKDKHFKVFMHSGFMTQTLLINENENPNDEAKAKYKTISLLFLEKHVIRSAMNKFKQLHFSELKKIFPNLESTKQFIEDKNYLGDLNVDVYNCKENLSQDDKLFIATEVLSQIVPVLTKEGISKSGSFEFYPQLIRMTFKDHLLKVSPDGSDRQYGKSMQNSTDSEFAMDVKNSDWHAYNDCFGTSEEKYLVKYIESIIERLKEKYTDIYLLRNEKDLKLYSFNTGDTFEPDYVMFMQKAKENNQFDSIQLFIEPKGEGYRANDKWKEDFLLSMKDKAEIYFSNNSLYNIWGLPFYTESQKNLFSKAFEEILSKYK